MSATPTTIHEPTVLSYPGTYGERPTPWQRVYMCTCGVELGFDEEGMGSMDPEAEYEQHLRDEGVTDEEDES